MTFRPRYETQQDRDNETAVQHQIEKWAKCTLKKTRSLYRIDWEAFRGAKLVALMEFKKRSNPRLQYPTYMVARKKIDSGIDLALKSGVPFIFFVQWKDGLYYLEVNYDTPMSNGTGGRTDRGDKFDIEDMAYFDTKLFKRVPD